MTQAQLRRFKGVLEKERAAVAERLTQCRHQISAEMSADALEETCYNTERDIAFASLNRDSDVLRDIMAALLRIEDGTFGTCVSCEHEVGSKRLAAVPWSARCVQ